MNIASRIRKFVDNIYSNFLLTFILLDYCCTARLKMNLIFRQKYLYFHLIFLIISYINYKQNYITKFMFRYAMNNFTLAAMFFLPTNFS